MPSESPGVQSPPRLDPELQQEPLVQEEVALPSESPGSQSPPRLVPELQQEQPASPSSLEPRGQSLTTDRQWTSSSQVDETQRDTQSASPCSQPQSEAAEFRAGQWTDEESDEPDEPDAGSSDRTPAIARASCIPNIPDSAPYRGSCVPDTGGTSYDVRAPNSPWARIQSPGLGTLLEGFCVMMMTIAFAEELEQM